MVCFVSCRGALACAVVSTASLLVGVPASGALFTGATGGDLPFSTAQPTLDLRFAVHDRGSIGEVRIFPYFNLPGLWLPASGQTLPVAGNAAFAAALGNAFGGDGVTDFALPDLTGRLPVGTGAGFGLTDRSRGDQFGASQIALAENQMPVHSHGYPTIGSTETAGGGQAHSTVQPSLGLKFGITTQGLYPSQNGSDTAGTPNNPYLGQVRLFSNSANPSGVSNADGADISIAQNTALFSLLGTLYGGNGQTTFGLPDLQGRTPIGRGQGPGMSQRVLGEQPGNEDVTLTEAQMPAHTHTIPLEAEGGVGGTITNPTGGDQSVDNMQPSLVINFLIRLQGVVPNPDSGFDSAAAYLGEIIMWGGSVVPGGWARCEGQLLPIAQAPDLFDLFGTSFGGDGDSTFGLPDLRGRGLNGFADAARSLGAMQGTETMTLGIDNLPSHVHEIPSPGGAVALALAGLGLGGRRRR